jgi:hypothetical protein
MVHSLKVQSFFLYLVYNRKKVIFVFGTFFRTTPIFLFFVRELRNKKQEKLKPGASPHVVKQFGDGPTD